MSVRTAEYPAEAEVERYDWLTGEAYIASRETAILGRVALGRLPLLELGCGEGANLSLLAARDPGRSVSYGVELSAAKLTFARARLPGLRGIAADARRLPLRAASFDAVLVRDLLHHVDDGREVLREAARVLAPGGALTILEANGRTWLARLFARLVPHERGLARSTLERLSQQLGEVEGLEVERAERIEPGWLWRLIFHYRVGVPRLARWPRIVACIERVERWLARRGAAGSYLWLVARRR